MGTTYVQRLTADERRGTTITPHEYLSPTAEQIVEAIRKLDGNTRTEVMLDTTLGLFPKGGYLGVGGGAERKYLVNVTYAIGDQHQALNPAFRASEATTAMVVGGQLGDYPIKYLVGIEEAIAAALAYARDGSLAPEVTWERL